MSFSLKNDVTVVVVVFVLLRAWDKEKSVGPLRGFNSPTFKTLPQSHKDLMLSGLKCNTRPVYCSSFVMSPTTSFYNSFRLQNLAFFSFSLSRWNFIIGTDLILAELTTGFFLLFVGRNPHNQVHVWHAPSKLRVTSRENKIPTRVTIPLLSVAVSLFPRSWGKQFMAMRIIDQSFLILRAQKPPDTKFHSFLRKYSSSLFLLSSRWKDFQKVYNHHFPAFLWVGFWVSWLA